MPLWFWLLVIGGLLYGLVVVALTERRRMRRRARTIRSRASALGFEIRTARTDHDVGVMLVLLGWVARPGRVSHLHTGELDDGTPVKLFDFEVVDHELDRPWTHTGFLLSYPTDWPTYQLGASGRDRPAGTFELGTPDHRFSGALLASELTEYLASRRRWSFAFSGPWILGATDALEIDDVTTRLEIADGIARRLPRRLVDDWRHEGPERRRRAG